MEGEEREGEGRERAMSPPPHYLEEVYAYALDNSQMLVGLRRLSNRSFRRVY